MKNKKEISKQNNQEDKKTAYNNQWVSTSLDHYPNTHKSRHNLKGD